MEGDASLHLGQSNKDVEPHYVDGCFNKYRHQSGSFVTAMANAIMQADSWNLERIQKVFPQMVAAHQMPSWSLIPTDFEPRYNADVK